jgi:hypothetical protein
MEKFSTENLDGHTWTYPPTGIGSKGIESSPPWQRQVEDDQIPHFSRRSLHGFCCIGRLDN